jgi:hypothetical protein
MGIHTLDPDKWPVWPQLLFFPPFLAGVLCLWAFPRLAKNPRLRRAQIALMIYAIVFGAFVLNPIAGVIVSALAVLAALIFLLIRWRNSTSSDVGLGRRC